MALRVVFGIAVVVMGLLGFREDNGVPPASFNTTNVQFERPANAIRIASFNIQIFGESKMSDQASLKVLVDTVRHFDIVAVQEVRALNQNVIYDFVDLLNQADYQYAVQASERLGRTNSKEQYLFIYDTTRVEIDPSSPYVVPDQGDRLEREPHVAGFRCRNAPVEQAFTFTLVNIHTKPSDVDAELEDLVDVVRYVQQDGRREDDIIMLGDLNADAVKLQQYFNYARMSPTIRGQTTNVAQTEAYDNILVDTTPTREFTGKVGVFNFAVAFNLTEEQAKAVSDHFPVWAEFSAYEGADAYLASQQAGPQR